MQCLLLLLLLLLLRAMPLLAVAPVLLVLAMAGCRLWVLRLGLSTRLVAAAVWAGLLRGCPVLVRHHPALGLLVHALCSAQAVVKVLGGLEDGGLGLAHGLGVGAVGVVLRLRFGERDKLPQSIK